MEFSNLEIPVIENGKELKFPFAGGLNSSQYGTLDLNLDDIPDLVIFDRSADKILTFISTGTSYEYSPEFEYLFPPNIQNWMVLADYDCDGKKDIFTYTNLGIRVFKNVSISQLTWELVKDPLFTQGSSSEVNLAVNSTDIPAIADLDGDDDLDILVFNFAFGNMIQFHQNLSIEKNGNCNSLEYKRVSQKYGDLEECSCDQFALNNEACNDGGRTLHAGGKSILAFDRDNDGDLELVIGQEECTNVTFLENKGSNTSPIFNSFTQPFPAINSEINLLSFPVPFYEDMNFDGLKDILFAPNLRSNHDGFVDNSNSSLLYKNDDNGSFTFDRSNFLQEDMIDVGEFSYPVFADVDGDSDDDLLIGNRGKWDNAKYSSSLSLYIKNPDGFVLATDDYFSLSQLNFTHINPSFIDLNNDGLQDLFFSAINKNDDAELFYILNSSTNSNFKFEINQLVSIVSPIREFEDAEMYDINQDGILDLLLARPNGILEYHQNNGTNLSPNYELVDGAYLNLGFSSSNGNLNINIADIDTDELSDLVTTDRSGIAKIYYDFSSESSEPVSKIIKNGLAIDQLETVLGRITSPAVGQVNGRIVLAFGNIQGGLSLLGSDNEEGNLSDELKLTVFPNPSKVNKFVKFNSPNEEVQFEIFGISGNRLVGPLNLSANVTLTLNLSQYNNGLYFARIMKNGSVKSVKFILGNDRINL
jgi:hypothetical protein